MHRGDRELGQEAGSRQDVSYEWTKQAVETVENVCLTLGELVSQKTTELKASRDSQQATVG